MARRDEAFVKAYANTINTLMDDFKSAPIDAQIAKIHEAHKAYLLFAEALDSNIIPESFIPIFVAIEATGGIPKVSGAGGGDNILAFYPTEDALRHAEKILVQTYPIFHPARSLDAKKK
jgi:mevalonate kinase